MKKIGINISAETLSFSFKKTGEKVAEKLLNTNVISNDELLFSTEYIEKNSKLVSLFIKELAQEKSIKNIVINEIDFASQIIDVISKISNLERLYLLDDKNLTFEICEKLIKYKNIKLVNCYSAPTFMIEMLDQAGILVESRCEVLFTSKFMEENNLTQYSKLYYKTSIRLKIPLTDEDLVDFETFCKVNRYLKTIHLEKCQIDDLTKIVNILAENKLKNIRINIHDNIQSEKDAEELKKLNRRWKNKHKIILKVVYSQEYVKSNYLKQVILMTLKVCSLLVFLIIATIVGYITINNKSSEKNVKLISDEITKVLETAEQEEQNEPEANKPLRENNLSALLNINSDTVGWLTVKGTNIDYPVVQTNDNEYYLTHNYKREHDYSGWVFMDFRNNSVNLNQNTVIYAHNRYYSEVMFGSLYKTLNEEWYTNEDNLTITYNTLHKNYSWKVFSIYKVPVTTDYLTTVFDTDEEFLKFTTMLKDRSEIPFNTQINENDKIITLSTCYENNRRLVLHAVLIEE